MQDVQVNNQQSVDVNVQGQQPQATDNQGSQQATPVATPQVDATIITEQVIQQPQNNFKEAQSKAKQKVNEPIQQNNNDVVKSFIDSFQQEYGKDEILKTNVESEVKTIQSFVNMKDKDEVMLSLLNQSVEKIEQIKKRQAEIQKEKEEIQKIVGYTEIIKKIDVIKKDKNYNEVWKILEEKSPKLAFDTFKSLTNNFINLSMNTKVADSPSGNTTVANNKTAMSAVSCVKKGDGYF